MSPNKPNRTAGISSDHSSIEVPLQEEKDLPRWHSRGYLPHFDSAELQFITIRLFDSVPKDIIQKWKEELFWYKELDANNPKTIALRKRIANYEDKGRGSCFLRDPDIAALVQNTLLRFDADRYLLINWSIMPNHVHVLIEILPGNSLTNIIKSWKSYTAHEANKILKRTGNFWMTDYFDRYVRNSNHYDSIFFYIDNNPVNAGLVVFPEDWKWSGARFRNISNENTMLKQVDFR